MNLHRYLYDDLNKTLYEENNNKNRNNLYPHSGFGKVIYAPTVKNICDPTWVILECDEEIINYYKWFLNKKGVKVDSPMWGSHISIIKGSTWDKIDVEHEEKWGYNNGQILEFQYGDLVTNGVHWWLEAHSKQLEVMRQSLGLNTHTGFGFHVTIGKISKYK